jgi:hypothetical protein
VGNLPASLGRLILSGGEPLTEERLKKGAGSYGF